MMCLIEIHPTFGFVCARFCVILHDRRSGQGRPRQGTEICNFGAKNPLEALHWIFCFLSSIYVQFSKTSPLKSGESRDKSSGENCVKSCQAVTSVAVMVFSALRRNSGVWRRGEIGKGCECSTCRGNPRLSLEHVWNVPSHEVLQTNYCARNNRNNAIVLRPLRTIASHKLLHKLLR